jgi:hypothetical protein
MGGGIFRPGAKRLRSRSGGRHLFRHEAAVRLWRGKPHSLREWRSSHYYHPRKAGPLSPGIGQPIGEPVAWYGPIVMNTQEELRIAFEEYEKGTFIKHK